MDGKMEEWGWLRPRGKAVTREREGLPTYVPTYIPNRKYMVLYYIIVGS